MQRVNRAFLSQVCGSGDLLGYVGNENAPLDRISLNYMVSCLPELKTLDVSKGVPPGREDDMAETPADPWSPACRRVLQMVDAYVSKRSRWCTLESFVYE